MWIEAKKWKRGQGFEFQIYQQYMHNKFVVNFPRAPSLQNLRLFLKKTSVNAPVGSFVKGSAMVITPKMWFL